MLRLPRLLRCALLLALVAFAPGVRAQDDGMLPATFSSDRPGFANTTGVAPRGRLITELGIGASFDDDTQRGELPYLSLRAGLFDWLEARVRSPNGVGLFEPTGNTFGVGDPLVGFKIGGPLHETLAISSVWEVSLPIGTDPFTSPEAEWRADLQADWRFWGPLSLTPNAVASVRADVDQTTGETVRFFEGGGSLKFTWAILDVLAVYVQSYALVSELSDWRVHVGGGLTWRIIPQVQVDASFDSRVTDQGDPPTARIGTTILW